MKVIGTDPSLQAFGVAVPGRTFTITTRLRGVERLSAIRREFRATLREVEPDLAVVERPAYVKDPQTFQKLCELAGVVRLLLYDLGVPFVDVPPSVLKLFATGKGNATKTVMLDAARVAFPLETFADDNQADARWLREVGLVIVGKVPQASEYQRRALAGVVVPNGLRRLVGAKS